ncbi:MAG: thiamine phosphate synthase [Sphingomonas fennica]
MTDERQGEGLWRALAALPCGSGVVFRHHATPPVERRALFDQVRRIARARRLVLVLAGPPRLARGWRADGAHGRSPHRASGLIRTMPAHDPIELRAARRAGADLAFVSPVFATRSHPGAPALGRVRLGLLLRAVRRHPPAAALGGMTARRARSLRAISVTRWAGIDAFGGPAPLR